MDLTALQSKTVLMFGKPRAFSQEEFLAQIQHHNITLVEEYNDKVDLIVEGRMITPYEQNLFDALYEEHTIPSITIDLFEQILADALNDDTLLMGLKLSHDTARLKSFLQNSCLSDALFFRLLKMYRWRGEDFFENDEIGRAHV